MSGPRYQVHFLSPNATVSTLGANRPTNRTSIEAARFEARSHAARVSHPGAKGNRPSTRKVRIPQFSTSEPGSTPILSASYAPSSESSPSLAGRFEVSWDAADKRSPNTTPPVLRFRLHVETDQNKRPSASDLSRQEGHEDLEEARRSERATSIAVTLPKAISRSALDPFARSALELSVPDEHLLHIYLSTVPDQIYGSAAGDVSEIIRNGTVGVVATNDMVVMWLLLVIESQVVSFQPTRKARQLSILTRRSLVYRLMNERLADEHSSLTDGYILAVAVAAASEHRIGNAQSAHYHIRAARNLLELRGGLRSIREVTYPLGLMVVNIFVEQGVDGLWKTQGDLRNRIAGVSQWIRDSQAWNFALRYNAPAAPNVSDSYPTPESDQESDNQSTPNNHDTGRSEPFNHKTALYDYVHLPEGKLDDAQFRFYLSILYAISTALYAFRNSAVTTNAYLKGVTTAVEMSALHNFTLRAGGAKLPSLLLLQMIAHNAVECGERNSLTDAVFHVEEVFVFVELMMMASPASRMNLLRALESWLTTPITTTRDLTFMSNAKLDILAGEVEEAWQSENPPEAAQKVV